MRIVARKSGMETATSMVLLIISAVLIFGVLNFYQEAGGNNEDLIGLRIYQVENLGEVLISSYQNSAGSIDGALDDEVISLFWDGIDLHNIGEFGAPIIDEIQTVMSLTPDGLSSLFILRSGERPDLTPMGEFVQWSHISPSGVYFTLFLSIHSRSMTIGGYLS